MATLKQIEANRLNAKKSTGPRSSEGKATSRMNALKSGIDAASTIIRGEDPHAIQALTAEYQERYQPATPEQRALVDILIHNEWLLRRLRKTEAQMWEREFQRLEDYLAEDIQLAQAFNRNTNLFDRLQRRIDSLERNYHRALRDLERLRPQSPTPQPDPPPAPQRVAVPEPRSTSPGPRPPTPHPIGFVPQARPETRVVREPQATAVWIPAFKPAGNLRAIFG